MKFKSTLRRYPWRRKKQPVTPDPDPTESPAGHLITSPARGYDPTQPLTRKVDPAAYNELVTPKDPALGLGTPDKSQILVTLKDSDLGLRTPDKNKVTLTPRAATPGLARPEDTHIVYTGRPVVVLCPASDEESDDDEFGEVRQVPINLYYDAFGNAIDDEAWVGAGGRRRSGGPPPSGSGPGPYYLSYGLKHGPDCPECLGDLKARYWVERECLRNYNERKVSEDATGCYWVEKDIWGRREAEITLGEVMHEAENDGEETFIGRADRERPLAVECGGGRSMWQGVGWDLPPHPTHYCPLVTHDNTSYGAPHQDVLWMYTDYPRVEWAGVGGIGRQAGVDSGGSCQSVGSGVTARTSPAPALLHTSATPALLHTSATPAQLHTSATPAQLRTPAQLQHTSATPAQLQHTSATPAQLQHTSATPAQLYTSATPAQLHTSATHRKRQHRTRNDKKRQKHVKSARGMKLWSRPGGGGPCDRLTQSELAPASDHLFEGGCGEGDGSLAPHHLTTAGGATLPGHTHSHTLTHIDYDSLRSGWQQQLERQPYGYYNGTSGQMDAVPCPSSVMLSCPSSAMVPCPSSAMVPYPNSVMVPYPSKTQVIYSSSPMVPYSHTALLDETSLQKQARRERRSVGVDGRRDEGAWLGGPGEGAWPEGPAEGAWPRGPGGQASGTCGALGQAGSQHSVSARALPRAHARSRTRRPVTSVHSEISANGNTYSSDINTNKTSAGKSELWPPYVNGVCEGECTCVMPCKVSGIPVYQGRGADSPRSPREDVPVAAPAGVAAGRGRGSGRRAVGNRSSATPSSRSPAQVGRRGSFDTPVSARGGAGVEGGVENHPRRASLPGPGGALPHTAAGGTSGVSSYRARTSPSPSNRSPARGISPGLGARAPSPAAPRKTPTAVRRREPQVDPRTPPSTPLSRRPPPRAVYQVRLSPGASSRDSPPLHREKPNSKLPVMASKPSKTEACQGSPRVFPPRPTPGRPALGHRTGKDPIKDRINDDSKGVGQTGIKVDTTHKPVSLSMSSGFPGSSEAEENSSTGGGDTSQDLSGVSVAPATDTATDRQNKTTGRAPTGSRCSSASYLSRTLSHPEKSPGLLRPGGNRLTSSASRLATSRCNTGDTAKVSDSKLERTLSVSSSHLTPKTSLTRTYSGPKSSLAFGDGANRARIVRRVMSGSRTNLSKKKSSSKNALAVGRHNLYNRTKCGSKNSLLGSRNNLFRASLDSQRTESTTDSGCNSPLYGSQCSLDGERRGSSSSPCSSLVRKVGSNSLASMISKSNGDKINNADIKTTENKAECPPPPPPRSPIETPDRPLLPRADPDSHPVIREPDVITKDMMRVSKIGRSVVEVCDTMDHKVNIVHAHSLSSSELLDRRNKSSVLVKRSLSLQFPSGCKPCPPPKPSLCDIRASSSSRITCDERIEDEGKENRPLPGINVSFLSISTRQLSRCDSVKSLTGANKRDAETNRDKKEVTKVSIVAEPKTMEEKGIQVEASSSEEETEGEYDDDDEEDEEEGKEDERNESRCGTSKQNGPGEEISSIQSQAGDDYARSPPGTPQPGPFAMREGRDCQSTLKRVSKNTIVHISRGHKTQTTRKIECLSEIEDNRSNEKKVSLGDGENHLIQRLETSLADIIDSAVLKNLKMNGNILSDQFDAIIATLKKVAASVDSGEPDFSPIIRRNSECGLRAVPKTLLSPSTPLTRSPKPLTPTSTPLIRSPTPLTPTSTPLIRSPTPLTPTSTPLIRSPTPLTPTSMSSSSSSSMSAVSPSTPRTPPAKTPLSLFSINEGYPGQAGTASVLPRGRKLSLSRDSFQDNSPTLGDLARRLHANPNHLRADQDYVDVVDLDQPYVSPAPKGVSTNELIRDGASTKVHGRKNSTGSLGLSSCASLLRDNSYYAEGPTTTASVTNLNSSEDYKNTFASQQHSFRKVNSTSNVNGAAPNGSHRLFQRHLSLCGPDDVYGENRLRKSLSKSRELLSQLENEYKKIKGDENKSARNSLVIDQSWLDKDFDELLQTLSKDKTIHSDPHEALAFLTNNNVNTTASTAFTNKNDKWRTCKKDIPPLPLADSPSARRHQSQVGSEGRHIFSFFQKKGRSQSLSGTEAIKITLPATPENGPQGALHRDTTAPGPRRVTYESATLDRPGRTNRSNSIPSASPQAFAGTALPPELVGIFKSRSKSLSKPVGTESQVENQTEDRVKDAGEEMRDEDEDEPAKQMRSLSLPKSFLSDKYGLTGFKAALPSVIFPWRRGEQSRGSGRRSPSPSDTPSLAPSPRSTPTPPLHPTNGPQNLSAADPKRKDGVWWRGRGGVSRTTRRDKASSSPVFRRASLSHSEWDIRRPWSHVYSEREAAKLSQSVCRLSMTSGEERCVSGVESGVEGPRSLPGLPSAMQTSSEGMFQKFKKSLSLRLAKKASRGDSPGGGGSLSAPIINPTPGEPCLLEAQTLPRRRGSLGRDDDSKNTGFLFGHPLFRSSKERRRARLKDARSSKCNSGDSGDSGIELVTTGSGPGTTLNMSAHIIDLDANNYVDPAFVASFADDGGSSLRDGNPRAVRRTHSDVGGTGGRSCLHYSRQLSTPQPIKIRPAHRLPQHTASLHRSKSLKRSKGSSHLRRSISQPLDLDKAYESPSSHKCTSPTHAHNRRQRRPSAGNILNDDIITSEDEIGISDSEDFRTDLKRSLDEDDDMIVYAEALWDHVTLDSEELVFKAGDLITVIDSSDKDWWWGRISHRVGWFPAAFVRILVNQEDHQNSRSHDDTRILGPVRKLSVSGLSHDQIRTNVINEIISTERDFVKHLRDVVKGYLRQVRKRPDMFSDERISTIFGNMEALYQFQSNFLRELELCIDWQDPHKSCIGAAFIRNREKFEIYSEYCNNHPAAMSSLQELYQHQKYIHFFEACRLLQEMIDISLDGFLLTPVQKICKYPLQLQELLKYTKPDHPDYTSVQGALEAMRDVALLVNERKRRMECLEKIASWQITVEGWEGPELLEDSSQLIYQGEVTKGAGGSWPKEVTLFLFDHQLVYCKRDLLKRNTFVYRGRLNLDMCEIVDLSDGKDSSLNISVHNAWKIHSLEKNKWYVFSCKTAAEKHKWMEAFRRERELVAADERAGFVVADKAKHLAKVAARNQRNRPKRPRSLWFSFGGHKKGRGSGRNVTQIQHHPV